MQRSDIRAVGDLAGEASSVLTTLARGMHAGIAGVGCSTRSGRRRHRLG
jgi:hypothetical protein